LDIPPYPPGPSDEKLADLWKMIHDCRRSLGMRDLVYDDDLAAVAKKYAEYHNSRRYYLDNWDAKGSAKRIEDAGIYFVTCGECGICSTSCSSAQGVINNWKASETFNPILTDPAFTHAGLGYFAYRTGG
jgi:uncharacterized protein YkwD